MAVQDRDIFTLRRLLQTLRSKALEDMMTDIIPRFRKSSHLKEFTSNSSKSKPPAGLSSGSMFGSRRHTVTGSASLGGAADEGSALAPASVSPDAASGAGGSSALRAGASAGAGDGLRSQKLSEWTVSKAVRHLGKRRRVLGVSIRVAPSVKAKEAIGQVVTACKANALREGFLHKRGGSKQSWKRRWCILSKEIGATYRPSDDHEEAEEADATATSSAGASAAAMAAVSSGSPSPTPADDDDAGGGVLLSSIPGMPALPGSAEAKASEAARAAAEKEAAVLHPFDLPALRTRKLADVGDGKGGSVKTSELPVEWVPAKRRSGGILLWFDDDKQPLPKGMIALAEVRGLVPDLSSFLVGTPFGFGLVTRRRLFVLQAVSKRTLGRWLDSMRLVLGLPLSASASPLARAPSEVGVFSRSRSVSRPQALVRAQSSRVLSRHSMAPTISSSRSIPPFLAEAPAASTAAAADAGGATAGASRLASSKTRQAASFDGAPALHRASTFTGSPSVPAADSGQAPPPPPAAEEDQGSQSPSPPPPPMPDAPEAIPSPPPSMPDAPEAMPSPPPPMPDAPEAMPSPPPPMPDAPEAMPSPPPPMPDAPAPPPPAETSPPPPPAPMDAGATPPPPAPAPPAPAAEEPSAADSKDRGRVVKGRKRLKGRVVKKPDDAAAAAE
jgi:hypothetical protein